MLGPTMTCSSYHFFGGGNWNPLNGPTRTLFCSACSTYNRRPDDVIP